MNTLILHASKAQKDAYLTKLASGEWSGTMCLTEPHCGTDLGQVKTKAEPVGDGTYKINGTKCGVWVEMSGNSLSLTHSQGFLCSVVEEMRVFLRHC